MPKFLLRVTGTAVVEIDDAVIAGVDDGWRKHYYNLRTAEEIAKHIGYNMMVNQCSLSNIDGFADRKDSEAKLTDVDWEMEEP